MDVKSWNVILACGSHKHGYSLGSFVNVKQDKKMYDSILDMYVETSGGKVFAYREPNSKPKFDFFIHIVNEMALGGGKNKTVKCWKLVTLYPNRTIERYIAHNGKIRDVIK